MKTKPMPKAMRISIIIPAYNEEKRIRETLQDYADFFSCKEIDFEILVMMDGCTDRTPEIVKDIASRHKKIKFINHEKRLGKGSAVLVGFKAVDGDLISFTDADNSIKPEEFYSLVQHINGYDAVISSRYMKSSVILNRQGGTRRVGSRFFNLMVKFLLGMPFKDTQCGAKVFKKNVIEKILPEMRSRGFEFDAELMWRVKRHGFGILEFPIIWENKPGSTLRPMSTLFMLLGILRIRFFG